uniref:Myb/SANT-like DNA-binding domain-containing protein n=1 Tax=Anopheles dirus TaxID=7168 RepID=A0A182NUU8_9DIPT
MSKRNTWSREETLELLEVLRTTCLPYLNGTLNNRKGQMYRQVEQEMQRRGRFTQRDTRQIEQKWKNLKFAYEKYNHDLVRTNTKPCEYHRELEELYDLISNRVEVISEPVKTLVTMDGVTYYDAEFVTEETQELTADEDAVVIEEIVYDSQDALEFEQEAAAAAAAEEAAAAAGTPATVTASSSSRSGASKQQIPAAATAAAAPKRKKLTAENVDGLLLRIGSLQREHNDRFNRKQMELIENEFEMFREKEREHLLQLKLDVEMLKQKFLARIQKIASGDAAAVADTLDEPTVGNEPKRRKVAVGRGRRK